MAAAEDRAFMRTALGLARRALGRAWPNPAVGCLIVRDGRVLGRGWTQPGGRPHAETVALAQAGPLARGATAYVSLEPCSHHGRTPPCAAALVEAGIARAVVALVDPDPRVAGRGLAALRAAGVAVEEGCLAEAAAALNCGFLSRIGRGRPWLTLKLAQSLDGRIATASGESRWITGAAARAEVHLARAQADAVLIGAGTARADDPLLDVRLPGLSDRSPVRVVVASRLNLPLGGRLGASAGRAPLWLCHLPDAPPDRCEAWAAAGALLIEVPADAGGGVDLAAALHALGERGVTRVLCEGGGALAAALVAAGLVDEIVTYSAGVLLGSEGTPSVGRLRVEALAAAPRLELEDAGRAGADLRARWRAP